MSQGLGHFPTTIRGLVLVWEVRHKELC
jgi:hypothetical protein